jgi:vacuolar protein-sorting-associated protein 4
MENKFIPDAIDIISKAIEADNAGEYEKALNFYRDALGRFTIGLKYEKNEARKKLVLERVEGYMKRAEELRDYIQKQSELDNKPGGGAAMKSKDDKEDEDNDAEKKKLRGALAGAIVTEKPNVKWGDVAGLEAAKDSLREVSYGFQCILKVLEVCLKHLENPCRLSLCQPGFLSSLLEIVGPSRVFYCTAHRVLGKSAYSVECCRHYMLLIFINYRKSYLAKAVATEADSTFFAISSSDLISKWQGESERLVRNLFELAREAGQAIIFIDEVDSLCGSRSEGESDSSRRVKTEFLVQMDGVGKHNEGKVLILGATNVPWELDAAIRRRFEKRVYIPLPEAESRAFMFKMHLGDTPSDLQEEDYLRLGQITEGASGSDIKVLVKEALMQPLRRCQQAKQFYRDPDGFLIPCSKYPNCAYCPPKLSSDPSNKNYECSRCGAITMDLWDVPPEQLKAPEMELNDFETVLKNSFSSVSPEELTRFTEWTKMFGQDGA